MAVNPYTGEVIPDDSLPPQAPGAATIFIDKLGRLMPDPTPIEPPIGYKPAPSLFEQIREMVRSETLRQAAEDAGAETFEEADDFEVGDDWDPRSPYENEWDTPMDELKRRHDADMADLAAPPPQPGSTPPEPLPYAPQGHQNPPNPGGGDALADTPLEKAIAAKPKKG